MVTQFLTVEDVIAANRRSGYVDFWPSYLRRYEIVASRKLHRGLGGVYIVRSFRLPKTPPWLRLRFYVVHEVQRDGRLVLISLQAYLLRQSAHRLARRCARKPGAAEAHHKQSFRKLHPLPSAAPRTRSSLVRAHRLSRGVVLELPPGSRVSQQPLPRSPVPSPTPQQADADAQQRRKRAMFLAALAAVRAAKTREEKDRIIRAVAERRFIPVLPTSWKVEIVADSSGNWSNNGVRFASREEADAYGHHLLERWPAIRQVRVAESTDPVNYRMEKTGFLPVRLHDEG
jgi:hypothetical protein